MTQMTLVDYAPTATAGVVYWMTDGYLIKVGFTTRTVKQRSGELRATVICFGPGSRDDERASQAILRPWCVGGEWFRLPDKADVLSWLRHRIYEWGGNSGLQILDQIIAANLRRAA